MLEKASQQRSAEVLVSSAVFKVEQDSVIRKARSLSRGATTAELRDVLGSAQSVAESRVASERAARSQSQQRSLPSVDLPPLQPQP